jgi:WD40 repeat protein
VVHHDLAKSILGISSGSLQPKTKSVTPTRVSSSPSLPVVTIPRGTEKHTQHSWSVKINKKLKPSLNMSFERTRFREYEGSVACVRFSSTGEYLAAGVNNKGGSWKVKVYDMKTGKKKLLVSYPYPRNFN